MVRLFNTDLAVSPSGILLAVYHKGHLYGTGSVLDQPVSVQAVSFEAPFSPGLLFGILVCFDMEFEQL